jgi:RimJ/RimL family protein N-acetyltransferase
MEKIFQLRTSRLLLRQWQQEDLPAFAQLNADAEVMRYFPEPLSADDSNALATKLAAQINERGWGLWAVEISQSNQFIGFVGLGKNADTPRGEVIEVGWRLARDSWGKGYATEGAKAALVYAFQMLKVNEVYSLTSVINQRSRAVMSRLGMTDTGENFDHPKVPQESPLREHVLYKIGAENFEFEQEVEIEMGNPRQLG